MVEVSFINPLSNEGRQIVKEYGDLNKLFDEDETLVNNAYCKSENIRRFLNS